jgi:cytochrome P450
MQELTINAKTFTPFSVGRYSCIGKQLGLMEVRNVAAQIVRRYDVALAQGQSPQSFLDGQRDTFTLALGPLELVLDQRKN